MKRTGVLLFLLTAALVLLPGASPPAQVEAAVSAPAEGILAADGDGEACYEQVVAYPCANCKLQGDQLFPVAKVVACDPATCQVDVLQIAACGVNFSAYYQDYLESAGDVITEEALDADFVENATYFVGTILRCAERVIAVDSSGVCETPAFLVDASELCGLVALNVCDLIENRLRRFQAAATWGGWMSITTSTLG